MRLVMCALLSATAALAQQAVPLWPDVPPGAPPMPAGREVLKDEHVTNIEKPDLTVFPAQGVTGAAPAVVILPGGGYGLLAIEKEGHEIARWLAAHGVAGVTVKYRVSPDDAAGYFYPVPLLDARRAVRIVRSRAAEWGIDPQRVGIMGFSAGGHLASLTATTWNETPAGEPADELAAVSARPDFTALIYPVIAMDEPYGHSGSRRRLLGPEPDPALVARCSTAKRVTDQTPPTFLAHAADDPVSCRNSIAFQTACLEHKVPVAFHLFAKGGHGYGMRSKDAVKAWPDLMLGWMRDIGVIRDH